MVLSESKRKANKKWDEKNKKRKQYINKRSAAKGFILNFATEEDIESILNYVEKRKEILSNMQKGD